MHRIDWRNLAALLALLSTSACIGDVSDASLEPADDTVADSDQAIINGNLVDPALASISTVVAISNADLGEGCSGALLTNRRVVTAKHCVPAGTLANHVQIFMGNQQAFASRLIRHPSLDVAVIDMDTAFVAPDPNAPPQLPFSDHGFVRTVYAGEAIGSRPSGDPRGGTIPTYLEEGGQTLNCSGFGRGTPNGSSGTLRQANLTIPLCSVGNRGGVGPCPAPRTPVDPRALMPDYFYYFRLPPNSLGQREVQGDSGGPCFFGDKLVSVFSTFNPTTGVSNELNSWSWSAWLKTL